MAWGVFAVYIERDLWCAGVGFLHSAARGIQMTALVFWSSEMRVLHSMALSWKSLA